MSFRTLLEPCVATIEIRGFEVARNVALKAYEEGDEAKKLVIWSDGSHRSGASGGAIVWRKHPVMEGWSEQVFTLDSQFDNNMAEFFAFYRAVQLARQKCHNNSISKVVVYTDSQCVLKWVRDGHLGSFSSRRNFQRQKEMVDIKTLAKELDSMGVEVVFRWVPGHSKVPGNVKADKLASTASKSQFDCMEVLMPSSSGYLESAPAVVKEKRIDMKSIRRKRIEKIYATRRTPLRRLYASRIERALEEIESSMQANPLLEILDHAIDTQIAGKELDLED